MDQNKQTQKTRLGRYELRESLGVGGMGEVFRAKVHGAAGVVKELCVKRIRAERLADARTVDRFIDEARMSMRLSHANIVPVFDFGRAGGEYYLAMEWVDGADLRDLLRGGPLAPVVAAHIGAEVARGLGYAHGLPEEAGGGLIHRDIKPGNVLVSISGEVKLVDFGVAAVAHDKATGNSGTPAYMAPEQERGEAPEARADIYSLGVLLRRMLTGTSRLDAEAEAHLDPGLGALMAELVRDADERPSNANAIAARLEAYVAERRLAGAAAPRDTLMELARGQSRASTAEVADQDLGTELSFLRDGDEGSFTTRMGGAVSSASPSAPPPGSSSASWRLPLGALLLVLVAGSLGAWLARPDAGAPADTSPEAPAPELAATVTPSTPSTAMAPSVVAPSDTAPRPVTSPTPRGPAEGLAGVPERPTASTRPAQPPQHSPEAPPIPDVAPGHLSLNAIPWAQVTIDGEARGETPLLSLELAAGEHRVRLQNGALGADEMLVVVVPAGGHVRRVVQLESPAHDVD